MLLSDVIKKTELRSLVAFTFAFTSILEKTCTERHVKAVIADFLLNMLLAWQAPIQEGNGKF